MEQQLTLAWEDNRVLAQRVCYYETLLAERNATIEECYQTIAAQRRYIDEQTRIVAIGAQLGYDTTK